LRGAIGFIVFFGISIAVSYFLYVAFYAEPEKEKRYWYWDATVSFVWYDSEKTGKSFALGKSRYKVRLPNGDHVAARSFLDETFVLYDCVRIRQHLSVTIVPIPYEIIGRADRCWKPEQ
jgi:hypothetical protein